MRGSSGDTGSVGEVRDALVIEALTQVLASRIRRGRSEWIKRKVERARPVSTAAPSQITVQVQAMDSQSFLDHSSDIALAVRQAMLQSSVLNDVIRGV